MNTFIVFATIVFALVGVAVSIWSLIDTRNKYFNEYIKRKKDD